MRSFSPHTGVSSADPAGDSAEIAYCRLEEARLRVELLAAGHLCGVLAACHRHLGLAGYHCSSRLATGTRLQWLALAHDRLRSDESDPVRGAIDAIAGATDAVERALIATNLADHIQETSTHALAACESFHVYVQAGESL